MEKAKRVLFSTDKGIFPGQAHMVFHARPRPYLWQTMASTLHDRLTTSHSRLLLLATILLAVGLAPLAAVAAPSSLAPQELLTRTLAAVEELTSLRAAAVADRQAYEQNDADLQRAIAEFQKPLPELPTRLDQVERADAEEIGAHIAKAEVFHKAWQEQREHHERARQTLAALEKLGAQLRPGYENLMSRIATLRPVLIEAQRRLDRRELPPEDFKTKENAAAVATWIARSSELAARREETLAEIDGLLARLETQRAAFAALPETDARTARRARGIATSLTALAEARAEAQEQRALFAAAPPETIPTLVERSVEEWKGRAKDLETTAKAFQAKLSSFEATDSERKSMKLPRREDLAAGTGLPEIQIARQDVEFAARTIAYHEKTVELTKKMTTQGAELLVVIEATSQRHAAFTRQSARLSVLVQEAAARVESGDLADWSPPADVTRKSIWDTWRHKQTAELERLEAARALGEADANAEQVLEAARARLAQERDVHQRAQARLTIELGYADVVERMEDESDEKLLALLAADGEVGVQLKALAEAVSDIEVKIAEASKQSIEAVEGIESVEDPYARAIINERAEDVEELRREIAGLSEGATPLDRSGQIEALVRTKEEKSENASGSSSAEERAEAESAEVARDQKSAREFLAYFLTLEEGLQQLQAGLAERRRLEKERDAQLDARVAEEKRRYAAARQIRRRIDEGRLDAAKAPKKLEHWLSRESITQATDQLRAARVDDAAFQERALHERRRLEILTKATPWVRIRSESADQRSALVGRPKSLMERALKPLEALSEVDRKNLDYNARIAEDAETPAYEFVFSRFTSSAERDRFEETRHSHYIELANIQRVLKNLEEAKQGYQEIVTLLVKEREELLPLKPVGQEIVEFRLFEYHVARYAAAIARHPDSQSRLKEAFRKEYGRELPRGLRQDETVEQAAENLLGAQARLLAATQSAQELEFRLSKFGLEQQINQYKSKITADLGSQAELEESKAEELRRRMAKLREIYDQILRDNAIHGLGIVLIIPLIAFALVRLLRIFSQRFERRIVRKVGEDITDRQRRMQTISATSTAAISVLVWTTALVYVFAQLGLDVTPIVASASVLGLAVAFGAQALIKDFFSGFFILIENQFTVGDVVTIGTISGTVERISLRVTVLRDLQGVVHYIPNGAIAQVSNKTQGWSRVVMEISVSLREDPDRATEVLTDVLMEMSRDERWARDIIEDPVVAGIEIVTERSVDIRIMIKTRPGKQWEVAREARRRVKKRFDQVGIEIPFPHRVVHHVYEGASPGGDPASRSTPQARSEEAGAD